MKNRRFPYGYEMVNGQIMPCKSEAEQLKSIFADYIGGMNLKEIADKLTSLKAEYLPGETAWNKSRIKRIIEDNRYLGTDTYPALISDSTFATANKVKDERRTVTDYVVTADNKTLTSTVHCAECGCRLYHRTDNTQRHNETWYCKTDGCKKAIRMPIAELEQHITHILNRIIQNPALIEYLPQNEAEPSLKLRRMENELERMLSSIDIDKDKVQNLILQCAAKKYSENTNIRHIKERLQSEFEKSSPLFDFSSDFFGRTVSAVLLGQNNTVSLVLKNGNIIGKEPNENDNASNDDAQNGQSDTAEAGTLR